MPVPVPTPDTRWRCTLCGNLTRFDVQRSTRAREYVHVALSGEPVVEERSVLADVVEHVTCRWCGRIDAVELVPRPGAESSADGGAPAAASPRAGTAPAVAASVRGGAGSAPAAGS